MAVFRLMISLFSIHTKKNWIEFIRSLFTRKYRIPKLHQNCTYLYINMICIANNIYLKNDPFKKKFKLHSYLLLLFLMCTN